MTFKIGSKAWKISSYRSKDYTVTPNREILAPSQKLSTVRLRQVLRGSNNLAHQFILLVLKPATLESLHRRDPHRNRRNNKQKRKATSAALSECRSGYRQREDARGLIRKTHVFLTAWESTVDYVITDLDPFPQCIHC